jgi:hypothetical protein
VPQKPLDRDAVIFEGDVLDLFSSFERVEISKWNKPEVPIAIGQPFLEF